MCPSCSSRCERFWRWAQGATPLQLCLPCSRPRAQQRRRAPVNKAALCRPSCGELALPKVAGSCVCGALATCESHLPCAAMVSTSSCHVVDMLVKGVACGLVARRGIWSRRTTSPALPQLVSTVQSRRLLVPKGARWGNLSSAGGRRGGRLQMCVLSAPNFGFSSCCSRPRTNNFLKKRGRLHDNL